MAERILDLSSLCQGGELLLQTSASPSFLIVHMSDRDEGLFRLIRSLSGESFALASFGVQDWNRDLSPWPAEAVFGDEPFGNGGRQTLDLIEGTLLPRLRQELGLGDIPVILGGYSLAGLFALWASYLSPSFRAVMSASSSLWFKGWQGFAAGGISLAEAVYLSLGKKEPNTRNPVMSRIGDCMQAQKQFLDRQGVRCVFEWNDGTHFTEPSRRCAKGYAWCMQALREAEDVHI